MGSQSTTAPRQSSSRSSWFPRSAQPRALPSPFAEDHSFVSPGPGALPRSVAQIASGMALRVAPLNLPFQCKLSVGETHDPLEAEADHMADRVLRMTDPAAPVAASSAQPIVQRKCSCEGTGHQCSECAEAERGKSLHRKAVSAQTPTASHEAPPIVQDVLRSPGQPLDASRRAFFEPRFGVNFGNVRVHADANAAASARAIHALAYTAGNHVVFGAGTAPTRLLAHELAHVVQQSGGRRGAGIESRQSDHDAGVGSHTTGAHSHSEPRCPRTYTIPDDVYAAIGTAWRASGQGGTAVTEHGGRIVTDSSGTRAIHTGSGGGGSMSVPPEAAGETTAGTFHTHPYSRSEGSMLGVSFSGADITNFVAGDQGDVKYVGAGTCVFVLNTQDAALRDNCKTHDLNQRWGDRFAGAGGSFQHKVERAVKSTIRGCGLCYYKACKPDSTKPIPKHARLA